MLEPNEIMKEISLDANKNEPTNVVRKKYGVNNEINGTDEAAAEEEEEQEEKIEEEEQKKEKKPSKKIKIPNTLIIYIKTRVPNFYKMRYEPSMSVPGNTSQNVYFEFSIEYFKNPIFNLPREAPPTAKYTQFFEPNEFETMINRVLSNFRYMQEKKYSLDDTIDDTEFNTILEEAKEKGIITKNIEITLQTLFSTNSLFYINKKPYTIVGFNWRKNNWSLDTKPLDKLIAPYSSLSNKDIKQAEEELNSIPAHLRQGDLAAASLTRSTLESSVSITKINNEELDIKLLQENVSLIQVIETFTARSQSIFSELLQQNYPVNYTNQRDIIRDPITLSLLVTSEQIQAFTKTQTNTKLITLYNAYIKKKEQLLIGENEFIKILSITATSEGTDVSSDARSILYIQYLLDKNMSECYKYFKNSANKNNSKNSVTMVKNVSDITTLYINSLYKLVNIIEKIYQYQNEYFYALLMLLKEIKQHYQEMISYYMSPILADKCIDLDIEIATLLMEKNDNNIYSRSYFSNYEKFKQCVECLNRDKQQFLTPSNYADRIEQYFIAPNTVLIEKYQNELYLLHIIMFYFLNQLDMWNILYNSINNFVSFISEDCAEKIQSSDYSLDELKTALNLNDSSNGKLNDFIKQFKAAYRINGVKLDHLFDYKTGKYSILEWYYITNEGQKAVVKGVANREYDKDITAQKKIINYEITKLNSYESILLLTYLLQIQCLRQEKLYVAEENKYQLDYNSLSILSDYYSEILTFLKVNDDYIGIQQSIGQSRISLVLPPSLMWDTSKLPQKSVINEKVKTKNRMFLLFNEKIESIQQQRGVLMDHCEQLAKQSMPTIGSEKFVTQCENIVDKNILSIPKFNTRSSWWIQQEEKNYDIKMSIELELGLISVFDTGYEEGLLQLPYPIDMSTWRVYKNEQKGNGLYASVRDALNGQIIYTNSNTLNYYTEDINGKQLFTIETLKQMVADNIKGTSVTITNVSDEQIILILESVLKIKFIIIDMSSIINGGFAIGDIVNIKDYALDDYIITYIDPNTNQCYLQEFPITKNTNAPIIMTADKLTFSPKNIKTKIRIKCNVDNPSLLTNINDFLYILVDDRVEYKYKFVRNAHLNKYIYTFDEIPKYIKYLIFVSCYQFQSSQAQGNNFSRITKFRQQFEDFENIYKTIINLGKMNPDILNNSRNDERIDQLSKKKARLEQELTSVDEVMKNLEKNNEKYAKYKKQYDELSDKYGGELTNLSAEDKQKLNKIFDKIGFIEQPFVQKQILLEKQIKIIDNLLAALKVNPTVQRGGQNKELNVRPRDRFNFWPTQNQSQYGNNIYQQSSPFNSQYYQSPNAYPPNAYPPNAYPPNAYPPNAYPYPYNHNKRGLPYYPNSVWYNPPSNKNTSKLAFYIELELALFPGKSANLLQKSVVQCQSTFEKIRQAYSEIFGYEYRPSAFNAAYGYNSMSDKQPPNKNIKTNNANNRYNISTKNLKSYKNRTQRRYKRRHQRK
jgi:hypothetical protein